MKRYNVGILGFGFIGKVHAYGYASLPFYYDPVPLQARITHVVTSRQETGRTRITVSDRGPGIPPAEVERIFRPFYRISNRLTDGIAGTGIGLAIARDLARLHGGDLVLETTEAGAFFCLDLATPATETGSDT